MVLSSAAFLSELGFSLPRNCVFLFKTGIYGNIAFVQICPG